LTKNTAWGYNTGSRKKENTMTKDEALKLLEIAPRSEKPSRLNPILTQAQAVDIVVNGVKSLKSDVLDSLFEKRVWQVCENIKRPTTRAAGARQRAPRHAKLSHPL